MKAMLPAAVFALVVGLILGAVIGCNKENDEKKLGDVAPWGNNALTQMTGVPKAGAVLVGQWDGTKWITIAPTRAYQQLVFIGGSAQWMTSNGSNGWSNP